MNAGPFASLISDFANNWATHRPVLSVSQAGADLEVDQDHLLHGELFALCSGRSASLPFFAATGDVLWCTIAPGADSLHKAVTALGSWVLPSFGGSVSGDPYIRPGSAKGGLAAKILAVSPDGYYRWRCPPANFDRVLAKLRVLRSMESVRPGRARPPRPSLYELRARFASALLIGDRASAEDIIGQLDLFQLETAVNTQFMRIRMWHHFGELDRIRSHLDLPHLLAQPLPPHVRAWINEALGVHPTLPPQPIAAPVPPPATAPATPSAAVQPTVLLPKPLKTWIDWFGAVKAGCTDAAEVFLQEPPADDASDFSPTFLAALCGGLDEIALDDALRSRERGLVLHAVGELLERYVREPEFPRSPLSGLYLSLLRLWCALHAGNSAGQEHGHVLLELACALLQLNVSVNEVCQTLEDWWKAKPAPSQLYFALDAIELMERELPDTEKPVVLWIEAADVIKRARDALPPADRALWRRAGTRLGFDDATISQYLPSESPEEVGVDPLSVAGLQHVAIVCFRERQAQEAAKLIRERTQAQISLVTGKVAGADTAQARHADVVLFVWMATSHAVFRAFDGYDRKRFCYVQGTGPSSIVRSLERWAMSSQ